jgi:hypothetical protein
VLSFGESGALCTVALSVRTRSLALRTHLGGVASGLERGRGAFSSGQGRRGPDIFERMFFPPNVEEALITQLMRKYLTVTFFGMVSSSFFAVGKVLLQ